jgi:acylaminoacyl-peptidase
MYFLFCSPDGKYLVFLSAKSAVDSGAHGATSSLHKIEWPSDGIPKPELTIQDVVLLFFYKWLFLCEFFHDSTNH